MPINENDQGGVNTPENALLTGWSHLFQLGCVVTVLAFAWLLATCVAIFFSIKADDGSFIQGLATNILASLLLLVMVPVLFFLVFRKSRPYSFGVAFVAAGVLISAAFAKGALQRSLA
jgi:hypothetical protein